METTGSEYQFIYAQTNRYSYLFLADLITTEDDTRGTNTEEREWNIKEIIAIFSKGKLLKPRRWFSRHNENQQLSRLLKPKTEKIVLKA